MEVSEAKCFVAGPHPRFKWNNNLKELTSGSLPKQIGYGFCRLAWVLEDRDDEFGRPPCGHLVARPKE